MTTEEYREAMYETLTAKQKEYRQSKLEDREKRTAARLGLIDEYTTTGKDGNQVVIKEDEETKKLYTNPESSLNNRYQELYKKYKSNGGK